MGRKLYKLKFEPTGQVFHSAYDPPKLIRLGSGQIIQWTTTCRIDKEDYAVYNFADIEDYTYIHLSDMEPV